jgi:hypothetical protein
MTPSKQKTTIKFIVEANVDHLLQKKRLYKDIKLQKHKKELAKKDIVQEAVIAC